MRRWHHRATGIHRQRLAHGRAAQFPELTQPLQLGEITSRPTISMNVGKISKIIAFRLGSRDTMSFDASNNGSGMAPECASSQNPSSSMPPAR